MTKLMMIAIAALALASCRTTQQMSDHDVCAMYGKSGSGKEYRTEIDRRGLISNWSLVDAHRIALGMNECEALAVSGATEVSRRVTSQGVFKVYQFRRGHILWTVAVNDGRVADVTQEYREY